MKGFRKRALYLAGISSLARVPGFLIPLMIAAVFGAGPDTDAYFLAWGAVLLAGGTLAQGIESAIVHFSASARNPRGFEDRAAQRIALVGLLIWLVVVPVTVIASPEPLAPAVLRFALLFTPFTLLWAACAAYTGGLIARWRIAEASASMLLRGGGALLGIGVALLGGGLAAVAAGLVIGEVTRLWWLRWRLMRVLPAAGDPAGTRDAIPGFGAAASAQVLAGATGATAPFIERILATTLGSGGVSMLEYASRLLVVPAVLFQGGLAPLLLARWSNDTAAGRSPSRGEVARVVGKGVALAALIGSVMVLLAHPVVNLVLGHGPLSGGEIAAIADLLRLLAIGFVATMGALLLERLYLAHARNRRLALLALVRVGIRLSLVVLLLPKMGLAAFAVGYAAAEWVYLFALVGYVPAVRQNEELG